MILIFPHSHQNDSEYEHFLHSNVSSYHIETWFQSFKLTQVYLQFWNLYKPLCICTLEVESIARFFLHCRYSKTIHKTLLDDLIILKLLLLIYFYMVNRVLFWYALRVNCPYLEFFCSVFSGIWSISPYLVRMRENTDQKNSDHGHSLYSDDPEKSKILTASILSNL